MKNLLNGFSFYHKQLILVIGINVVSLAFISIFLYNNIIADYRDNLVNSMKSKATIIASTGKSALLFDDDASAESILNSLSESTTMNYAQIYRIDKTLFAEYKKNSHSVSAHYPQVSPGAHFNSNAVTVLYPIVSDGENIGYIVMSASLEGLREQNQRYARIILAVFICSAFFAYILNWRLQGKLMAPINRIIDVVSAVAKERTYHRRVDSNRSDELGILCDGINSMLDTIQKHESLQQENTEKLEGLVALRTEQLFQRANYDALTQLPNRHLLTDRLNHAIDHAERVNEMMALIFLDLDRFKVINDSLGHGVGDQLLIEISKRLSTFVRKADSVCRWGGDEFVILLEHVNDIEAIREKAEKIVGHFNRPIDIQGHQLHVTASMGVACFPADGRDSQTLLMHADISMYKAKEAGKGTYRFYQREMAAGTVHRIAKENQIRSAVNEGQFYLTFQPKVLASSGKLCGAEALIRWKHEGRVVSPADFLPIVEELGLMNQLTVWVINEVCRQNKLWQNEGLDIVPISVNVPGSYILLPNATEQILTALNSQGLDPKYMEVEITEDSFVSSTRRIIQNLKSLKSLGVAISIDDFGTGYSCMSYLRDLPVSIIKIDGSFVQSIGKSEANDGIVKSIITLGKSLGLNLVGEAAESENQVAVLRELGCDIIQGYYYSKPLDAHAMRDYLLSMRQP